MCPGPSNDNNYNNNRRTCRDLAFCGYHVIQLLEIVNYLYKIAKLLKRVSLQKRHVMVKKRCEIQGGG